MCLILWMQQDKLVSKTSETLSNLFFIMRNAAGNIRLSDSAFMVLSSSSHVCLLTLRIFISALTIYEDTFNGKLDIYDSFYQILTYFRAH
jgi:hypothetical protein